MKLADITAKNDKDLATLLVESRKQIAGLAIDMRTKQIPNVKQVSALKKTVARILTTQNHRALNSKEENHG